MWNCHWLELKETLGLGFRGIGAFLSLHGSNSMSCAQLQLTTSLMTIKDKDIVVGPDQRGFNPEPNYDSRFPVLVPTSPSAPPEGLRNRQSSYARLKGPNSNEVLSQLASLNSVLLHQDVNRLEAITCD